MTETPRDARPAASRSDERLQDERIAEAFVRERPRLWRFIRSRVHASIDAEDILQDVFYELVVAYRLMKPMEHLGGWLFQVARNRITDRFRRREREAIRHDSPAAGDLRSLADLLPSREAGPEAAYARTVLLAELEDALAELPGAQREVFIAHELEGRSFKAMAAEAGVSVNTLLSRKRYAVLRLRRRLQSIYDDLREKRG